MTDVVPQAAALGRIDDAYRARLHDDVADPWLVLQTVATAQQRRMLLQGLRLPAGARVLDAGCGYGPVTMELAAMMPVHVLGIDMSPEKIAVAQAVAGELAAACAFDPGSTVELRVGDICANGEPDGSVDAAVARFVLEYLPEPDAAVDEMHRVIRPGGLCCLIDVDDGLSITYPAPLPALGTLVDAFAEVSVLQGVDRRIGRKLAGLLDDAGFDVVGLLVLSQAEYGTSAPDDVARTFLVKRFAGLRDEIVRRGVLAAAEFDAALESLASDPTVKTCNLEGHVAAVGMRRP